ncbi:MAG: DUF4892 domain-containing protein [Motiliproteus sp.]|nr:DUF4892 domain-containing protein [Motiliproteus sp.]MCW9051116.1 DUF4892 domain-containing protein [Motiliproteus sp.]
MSIQIQAANDVAGSEDINELKRYPLSYIDHYSQLLAPEYRLALGTMKKVNGVLSPEQFEFVGGQLTRITYRIPSGHRSDEVFKFFTDQLDEITHEVLFSCEGRSCGSSNAWANSQFGIAKLYGIDREQYYRVVRLEGPSAVTLVLYSVRRGNKRVYMHLDVIREKSAVNLQSADQMLGLLLEGQRLAIAAREWPEPLLENTATAIKGLLRERPLSTVWLVGHLAKEGPVVRLQNDADVLLKSLKSELVDRGVDEHRLKLFSVGPLAPVYDDAVSDSRVELIVE